MDDYKHRCMALVVRLDRLLPSSALTEAQHMIDHGEASLGVETLAWAAVAQGRPLPRDTVADIRALVLDENELPSDLDRLVEGG